MSAVITALAVSAVGTGVSAYSSYSAGKSAQSLNNYNATVTTNAANYNADLLQKNADYNATIEEQNARTIAQEANASANAARFNNKRILASQRAGAAASGVVGGTGSPLIAEVQNTGLLEMRAIEIERQGNVQAGELTQSAAMERWQAGEQAKMERYTGQSQATLDRMQGAAAARAGTLNSAATLLQGAGNTYGQYGNFKYNGLI